MSFVARLGLSLPLIQAPMAGVQGSRLALAVCNAGGLGSLPAAMLPLDELRREMLAMRTGTHRPWQVNFFAHTSPTPDPARETAWRQQLAPYYREFDMDPADIPAGPGRMPFNADTAALVEEFRPAVVSFHFGLPDDTLMQRVKATGARVLSSATTVDEALWLEHRGVDAIIAQGLEAGGHRGMFLSEDLTTQMGTFALLPQIVARVRCPVIAAGGIATPAGAAAARMLGADAIQVGTAYLCCNEATTNSLHRAALHSDAARHTALTNLFSGRPARGIVNRLMREIGPMSAAAPAFPLAGSALAPLRTAAEKTGRTDFTPLWSGQNPVCPSLPAAEISEQLARGFFGT